MNTRTSYISTELYHHGILGQKWGKKNGPPYPLDDSDHSSSERKAGWKDSLSNSARKAAKKEGSKYSRPSVSDVVKSNQQGRLLTGNNQPNTIGTNSQKSENPSSKVNEKKLEVKSGMSQATKKTIQDYNSMSDEEFMSKYFVSKSTYAARIEKYGDPYQHATSSVVNKVINSTYDSVKKSVSNSSNNLKYATNAIIKKVSKKS